MKYKRLLIILILILLSGCWDSVELDESIMVVGIGISKGNEDEYKIVVEAVAPSELNPNESELQGKSILLETSSETLFDAAREIIRVAKRRLFFTHAEVWVIHSDLASNEDMLQFLDILRREQMLRLNSYLFISEDLPKDIFTTEYTFSNILSEELISGLEYAQYVSDYPTVRARDYFKRSLGPLGTSYLPIIKIIEQGGESLSQLTGAAIFKEGQLIGRLSPKESFGLMWINDEVKGGNITIGVEQTKASFKLIRSDTRLTTKLNGNHLTVHVDVEAEGKLADQHMYIDSINKWIHKFEKGIEQKIKKDIDLTLNKLQKEFKTDSTNIGIEAYRKQPHLFNEVKENWDDVFAEATIHVKVNTKVVNKGLIESSGFNTDKPGEKDSYHLRNGI